MSQDIWNYIFIGISFALYIGIALKSRASSTKEYYTAGGGVSPFANGMATAADWMSAATFISMAGGIAISGYDGSMFLMGWTGGFVLLTILMVPYLRKFGKATVPDFIGDRYYSQTARFVAVICALFICMTYIMGQMNGVGIVFSQLFGISLDLGVIIGASIVFFYAGLGGMKGITYTQVAQYCVMAFAYTLPAIFISMTITGNVIPQLGFIGETTDGTPLLEKINTMNESLGIRSFTEGTANNTVNMFCITAALMCGTAGLPHVIVRFFTVKNVKAVRKSACWTLAFIAVIYLTAPAVGVFSRLNLVEKLNNKAYTTSETRTDAQIPTWYHQFEKTGKLAWVDKNNDGIIQYKGNGSKALNPYTDKKPILLKGEDDFKRGKHGQILLKNPDMSHDNELHVHKDIMVMANPYMGDTPQWVIALLMAGCIAAALSTAAGLLLVLSTAISHDLMKKIIKPDLTDKQEMKWARYASLGALIIAVFFGINPPGDFVAQTVAFAFGLAASSFFPTLLMGIFSKRVNKQGGVAGMAAGISFTLAYIIYFAFMNGDKADYILGISPAGIGFVGMLINFIVTLTVSAFTPAPPEDVQRMVRRIHNPSGAGDASH